MIPLDKGAALEHVVQTAQSKWRVEITRQRGVCFTADSREDEMFDAIRDVQAQMLAAHPDEEARLPRLAHRAWPVHGGE